MERPEIKIEIDRVLKNWITLQREIGLNLTISKPAIDFIFEAIQNIENDPSEFWQREKRNMDGLQRTAIQLIPSILSDIIFTRRGRRIPYRYYRIKEQGDVTISTWEIWHGLSDALDKYFFIPKDL